MGYKNRDSILQDRLKGFHSCFRYTWHGGSEVILTSSTSTKPMHTQINSKLLIAFVC